MLPRLNKFKKSITLRDVAKHAGVSPKTVSNVINDWPYVSDETRQKVKDSIEALGFRPNGLATSLRLSLDR
jgi:DNA-binding LacI/PurR family transcriptional regulator